VSSLKNRGQLTFKEFKDQQENKMLKWPGGPNRMYMIANVLEGLGLAEKVNQKSWKWLGFGAILNGELKQRNLA
jgi:hypothetical protein